MTVFAQIHSAIGAAVTAALPGAAVYLSRPAALPDVRAAVNVELGDSRQVPAYMGDLTTWVTEVDIELCAQMSPKVDPSPQHAAEAALLALWQALQWASVAARLAPLGCTGYVDDAGRLTTDLTPRLRRQVHPGAAPVGVILMTLSVMHHTQSNTLDPYLEPPP